MGEAKNLHIVVYSVESLKKNIPAILYDWDIYPKAEQTCHWQHCSAEFLKW